MTASALPYYDAIPPAELAEDVLEASFARGLASAECFEVGVTPLYSLYGYALLLDNLAGLAGGNRQRRLAATCISLRQCRSVSAVHDPLLLAECTMQR